MRVRVAVVAIGLAFAASFAVVRSSSAQEPHAAPTEGRAEAIARYESFLERYPESSMRAQVLFTLGQLHEEEEVARALGSESHGGASDDRAFDAIDSIAHPNSVRCYDEIVDRHPAFAERPAALYRLGVALVEQRDDAAAAAALSRLLTESPESPFTALAHVRLGEIGLRASDPRGAARAYEAALAAGGDPHAEKLNYRLGWARYNARDGRGASEALLAGIALEESLGSDPDVGFEREMIHLLSVVEASGSAAETAPIEIEAVIAQLSGAAARRSFLQDYGMLLEEADRSVEAIAFLDRAMAEAPSHAEAPAIAQAAISAAVKSRRQADAAERMVRYAETFGAGSEWRAAHALPADEAQPIDDLCEEHLYRAGVLWYEDARQRGDDREALARAEGTLRLAIRGYPRAPERDEAWFLVGEASRTAGRWRDAIAAYDAADPGALAAARREPLLYGRVLAREALRADAAKAGGDSCDAARAEARAEAAAIDAYLAAAPRPEVTGSLRKKRGELLAIDGRYAEAAAVFEETGDAERAAAALYADAAAKAARGEAAEAGLALLDLVARHPAVKVAPAARLDAVEHLSRGGLADTLAAWLVAIPDRPEPRVVSSDSLARVVFAAADRLPGRDAAIASRLYLEAARFGRGEEGARALARAGESQRIAGRTAESEKTLASGLARFPGTKAALAAAFVACDLAADTLGDAPEALRVLDAARAAAGRAGTAERVAWARRRGHALALAGRSAEALAAIDECLALGGAPARASSVSAAPVAAAGAPGAFSSSDPDTLRIAREMALAALEKGDLMRTDVARAASGSGAAAAPSKTPKPLTARQAAALSKAADDATRAYDLALSLSFRDLVSRAGWGAAETMAIVARALAASDVVARETASSESVRRAAARAVAYALAVVSLPEAREDRWVEASAGLVGLRREISGRTLAAVDSIAEATRPADGASEIALSRAIVELAKLAAFLEPARDLAREDGALDLVAAIGLRQGSLYDDVATLIAGAPAPADLSSEERTAYLKALSGKADDYREKAAGCYEAALDQSGPADEGGPAVDELRQRVATRRSGSSRAGGGSGTQEGEPR